VFSAMLVTFREGLEAALIIAVLISLLNRFGEKALPGPSEPVPEQQRQSAW